MLIECKTRELRDSLVLAASAAASHKNADALSNVLAVVKSDRIELNATDREVSVRVVVDATVSNGGEEVLLPTRKLQAVLSEIAAEEVLIDVDRNSLTVKTSGAKWRLSTEQSSGFPQMNSLARGDGIRIPSVLLRKIVSRTVFATDKDSTRYALGGVLFELSGTVLTCAATDSRRLALCSVEVEVAGYAADFRGVVPVKVLRLLEKFPDCDVTVSIDEKSVYFVSSRYEVTGRLVEGRFPRYRDVIPGRNNPSLVRTNVAMAASAVKQSQIVTTEDSRGVIFVVRGNQMRLQSAAAEVGDSEIVFDVDSGDSDVTVTLDPKYIADFLKCVPQENVVEWLIIDADTAIVITDGDSYRYIVMPLSEDR
jgi:DNA polymerase-3 subunit beta